MNKVRQRKLDARARRQESLHNQGVTAEKTVVKVPQPKALVKKEKIEVVKNVEVKRGRGRPPKVSTSKENIKTALGSSKKKGLSGLKEKN